MACPTQHDIFQMEKLVFSILVETFLYGTAYQSKCLLTGHQQAFSTAAFYIVLMVNLVINLW